ncbi:MAG TPA: TolC family outer membrane protein [Steroidobacteraceae bacterium]|nr:TolC family outer membrane protein [Steroidobacteraceae bacterium]
MKHALVAAWVSLTLVGGARASDLVQVYDDAVRFDPQIAAAQATRMAARENSPQALAALLPQVSGNWAISRTKQVSNSVEPFPSALNPSQLEALPFDASSYADERQYNLQLQQSVFSWANWKSLSRAHKQVAQAEADYKAAQEDLIQRVATAYFSVLAAQDIVDADQAALNADTLQLEQDNKRYDVGLIPITNVKETQAAHDAAAAAVIEAKRQLASMQLGLREITDQDYPTLAKPGDAMALNPPQPADPQHWVDVSMDQNLSLISSRLAADVARDSVEISRSGHLPTVSISAARGVQNETLNENLAFGGPPANIRYPQSGSDNQIQLQVTVPIFSGGLVQSQVRQAQYQWIAAKDRVQQTSRQTERNARDAYNGLVSKIAQVNALRQGLDSAQVALQATEAGYQVGTRTTVDVLQERQALVQAQTSFAQARYDYMNDVIALQLAAGTLTRDTLVEIDKSLTAVMGGPAQPSP